MDKVRILKDYDSTENYHGKQTEWAKKYNVQPNFFKKARITIANLNQRNNRNTLLVRVNAPGQIINSKRITLGTGRPVKYPAEEDWLYLKFEQMAAHDIPVTTKIICAMLAGKYHYLSTLTPEQMKQWCYRWQRRYSVVCRRVTHSHEVDEQNIGEVRVDFINYYNRLKAEYQIDNSLIINMDETAVDLSECITHTLAAKVPFN
jgi:hypothetical protein